MVTELFLFDYLWLRLLFLHFTNLQFRSVLFNQLVLFYYDFVETKKQKC